MPNYKEMYLALFNQVSEVIEELQAIQQKTEEMYLSDEGAPTLIELTQPNTGKAGNPTKE